MHLAYIWIVSHLSAKNNRNLWKFDKVLTKTNLLSFFGVVFVILLLGIGLPYFDYNIVTITNTISFIG